MNSKILPLILATFLISIIGICSYLYFRLSSPQSLEKRTTVAENMTPEERDKKRYRDLYQISTLLYAFIAEHNGDNPNGKDFPTVPTCVGTNPECFNLFTAGLGEETIVPDYAPESYVKTLVDPLNGSINNTGYKIHLNEKGRILFQSEGELKEISFER